MHCFDTFVKPNLVAPTYCELTLGSYFECLARRQLRGNSTGKVTFYAFN
jgi:hypothetical protein